MLAFKVIVNGQLHCTMGMGPTGSMHAFIGWSEVTHGRCFADLRLSGLTDRGDEQWIWPSVDDLKIGDKIEIEIVEIDDVDPPNIVDLANR